ncbi:hypothetical protein [Streptomonospora arabica]|uniref:Uncharacterized protein n=1 Tax=Streptomonospora arabica TaxID=412417 RepID=A0ABV9SRK6_9ACTN
MPVRTSAHASDALPGEAADTAPNRPGRKVGDTPVGVLSTGPASLPRALLLRRLSDDLAYSARTPARVDDGAARGAPIVHTPAKEAVVKSDDGDAAGVRPAGGASTARRVLAVATRMQARTEGRGGLEPLLQDLKAEPGRRFACGTGETGAAPAAARSGTATA